MSIEDIARLLKAVRWNGDTFTACCPAHEDKNPSLSVKVGDDGGLLVKCHAGCDAERIVRALGLEWRDVMPPKLEAPIRSTRRREYQVRDRDGKLLATHVRTEYTDTGKKAGGMPWSPVGVEPKTLPLWGWERVKPDTGCVIVCEGERAADAVWERYGEAAVGIYGATCDPCDGSLEILRGKRVVLWPDHDEPGHALMDRMQTRLEGVASRVQWIVVRDAKPHDDAVDFRGDIAALRECVKSERPKVGKLEPNLSRVTRFDAKEALRYLDSVYTADPRLYVSTGLATLDDKLLGGMRRGELVLLGAGTGKGKTTLALQMAVKLAEQGKPCLVVAPEMGPTQLAVREIVRRSGWSINAARPASPSKETAWSAHAMASQQLDRFREHLYVMRGHDVPTLPEIAEAAHEIENLHLIVLDYAQDLAPLDAKIPRWQAVGLVGEFAEKLARELNVVVVLTSQMNVTKAKKRGDADEYSFRESAILEQKAATALVLMRDEYVDDEGNVVIRGAKIHGRKARSGYEFVLPVLYIGATFEVRDL